MTSTRRILTLLLTLLFTSTGWGQAGQSSESAYIATRDIAIAKVKKRDDVGGATGDAETRQDTRVLHGLETQLRRLVEPVRVAGFSPPGKLNLETLSSGDIGFGALDALVFPSRDGKTNLFVTTEGLLARWLKQHETWWEHEPISPKVDDALRLGAFYTQGISADSAIYLYEQLPIPVPPTATFAIAELDASSQDLPPALPDELIVSVIRGGKVFILVAPLKKNFVPVPACEAISADYAKRQQRLNALQAAKSGASNPTVADGDIDPIMRLEEEGSAAALDCFKAHSKNQPAWTVARDEAQDLVDLVMKSN